MDYVVRALRENPELAVFLTLAVGFLIGRLKIGSFSLGTVVGTLLAGVGIGQLNLTVPSTVKSIFFLLFLFTTGYKVGPQFFRGLKRTPTSPTPTSRTATSRIRIRRFWASQAPTSRTRSSPTPTSPTPTSPTPTSRMP